MKQFNVPNSQLSGGVKPAPRALPLTRFAAEPPPQRHALPARIGHGAAHLLNFHVPAPGIEPGTTALSERCTAVVLDGGTGTGRILSFSEVHLSAYSAGTPGLLSVSRQLRMPFLLQLPARSGSGSESVGHAGLKPAIS